MQAKVAGDWKGTAEQAQHRSGGGNVDGNTTGIAQSASTDILHLGGNSAERNIMAWLDGKLDASDPAFAAIKLWVDVNHNGRMEEGESTCLQSIQLTSVDLHADMLNYAGSQSDQLSTAILSADTEGVKLDSVKVVDADGKLKELDAGALVVHEHYDGMARTVCYEPRANSGDWEKTADAAAHRHGGGNAAGAPTQTSTTEATITGAVLGKTNVTTATTMDVGDKRITSDALAQKPVVFIPACARGGWITEDGKELPQLPQDGLFGARGLGTLGVYFNGKARRRQSLEGSLAISLRGKYCLIPRQSCMNSYRISSVCPTYRSSSNACRYFTTPQTRDGQAWRGRRHSRAFAVAGR